MCKATNVKLGSISDGPCEQKPLKIWEKMERGRIQALPQFFWVHHNYYLRNW